MRRRITHQVDEDDFRQWVDTIVMSESYNQLAYTTVYNVQTKT